MVTFGHLAALNNLLQLTSVRCSFFAHLGVLPKQHHHLFGQKATWHSAKDLHQSAMLQICFMETVVYYKDEIMQVK